MAVVNKLAAGLPDPSAAIATVADRRQFGAAVRVAAGVAEIANGDSATSTYEVARIPSHARILKTSQIRHTALTGVSSAHLGADEDPDVLLSAQTLASAGTKEACKAVAVADEMKPLWELLGMDRDPGREIPIKLTINADAGADGTAVVDLRYVVD